MGYSIGFQLLRPQVSTTLTAVWEALTQGDKNYLDLPIRRGEVSASVWDLFMTTEFMFCKQSNSTNNDAVGLATFLLCHIVWGFFCTLYYLYEDVFSLCICRQVCLWDSQQMHCLDALVLHCKNKSTFSTDQNTCVFTERLVCKARVEQENNPYLQYERIALYSMYPDNH